jgi:hypothetical protein
VRDSSSGSGKCGREWCQVILPKWRLPRHLGIFYMPQIYDMGPTALLSLRSKACWWCFFALKNPTASAGFKPANLGTKGQHATPRPPNPLHFNERELRDVLGKADQTEAKGSLSFPDQLQRKTIFLPKLRLWIKVRDCTYFLQVGHPTCVAEGGFLSFITEGRQTDI